MSDLAAILARSARAHRDRPAIRSAAETLTYGELDRLANRFARALAGVGVGAGARVGLWLDKSPRAVAAMQGALRAGGAYVPLDPSSPARRVADVARDCGIRVVVTTHTRAAALAAIGLELAAITEDEAFAGGACFADLDRLSDAPVEAPPRGDDDLAYILYTSGSTGKPKGVCLSHGNALAFVRWAAAAVGARAGDRFASHAPFHFDLSVFDLYVALASGGTVHLVPEGSAYAPRRLIEFVREHQISVWYSVPTALMLMVEEGLLDLAPPPLRVVIFAGEPFPIGPLRRMREAWPEARLFNFYGPTETNVCTAYEVKAISPDRLRPVPIGTAASFDDVWAEKEDGSAAGAGEEGELVVSGPSVMLGYWGEPPQRGPYRTGDRVRQLADGDYEFLGRHDHMVKVRGHRIELGDIEACLLAHPGLRAAAVVVAGQGLRARIMAYVVAREGAAPPSLLRLKQHCAERLPRYMIIDEAHYRDALPRTANGKIDRLALASAAERALQTR